jgi:transcriptional regulator with XRE-family HTH domain
MGVFAERLGARIKQLRKERGLSVIALARATKVTRQTLYNIERGVSSPSVDHVSRLARALRCEELDLVCLPEAHPRHAVADLLRGRPSTLALEVMAIAKKIVGPEP